jgi:hypothetical protein
MGKNPPLSLIIKNLYQEALVNSPVKREDLGGALPPFPL